MNELLHNCCNYIDCKTKRKNRDNIINDFKCGNLAFIVNV